MMFSVIVVCLNAGEKLNKTLDSIFMQDCADYEVVVKDGESTDGSVENAREAFSDKKNLKVVVRKDAGIYDAMNQALTEVSGEYVIFLNCGDSFYDAGVLSKAARHIGENAGRGIYYGDTFYEPTKNRVASPKKITAFVCYRNIPCHQACFYQRALFDEKKYDTGYRIRADYDHFLWCCLRGGVSPSYMDMVVASYEGGGYSENRKNRRRDKEEHRLITGSYMSPWQRFGYRAYLIFTLAPLRRVLAGSRAFSGVYNKLKAGLYR